ncbi:nuclear transport factor 2 family protein [Nonomuraea sp. NPDC049695]|uniref:nuclear transport factor 2 family protein n=1 Tax=Nonomuraea sp. NPDC049695 TaxID=3154734 RepID=UPI00343AF95D
MADHATLIDELRQAEDRLQAAQLAGDVEELDRLLHEQLVFTGPPDGLCHPGAKELDLHNHRSRTQIMTKVAQEDLTVLVAGDTGVTCFLGTLEGTFAGTPFAGRMAYTRTWTHTDEHGWRVLAAHSSPA